MTPDKLNGWATVLRLILPVMVGFMLFMLTDIKTDLKQLGNDYYHEIKTISERLVRIETTLKLKGEHHAMSN